MSKSLSLTPRKSGDKSFGDTASNRPKLDRETKLRILDICHGDMAQAREAERWVLSDEK